jgi:YqjK-like protein
MLRRERLLMRSAELRAHLARQSQALAVPLARVDRALDALRWLREHPQWPLGALALWAAWRPRRTWRWAVRAWWLWRAVRRLQRLLMQQALIPEEN